MGLLSGIILSIYCGYFSSNEIVKKIDNIENTINQKIKKVFLDNLLIYPYYKNEYLPGKSLQLIRRNIFRIQTNEKKVYLTFDDGPAKISTVDYLKKNNISATFFLICNRIKKQNITKYNNNLFTIGAHTFSHRNYDTLNKKELYKDISRCSYIFKQNSLKLTKFRTAFGIINKNTLDILEKKKIQNYLWNIDSYDWKKGFTKKRAKIMSENVKGGDIILFHETLDLKVLDFYIKLLEKKGFSFGKL